MAGAQSVQGLVEFIRTLGAARLGAMAAVTAALVGMFGFIILRVTAPQMSPVFTDLTPEDSAAIVKDLERQAIPYELKNDGAIVMVPRDKLTRIRMKLAEGGLPKGGGVGYEIFDKSDALGATSLRPEHQPPARARRRACPHHQGDRPRAGGARAPRPARAAAVLARQGRAVRLDRAARARRAGGTARCARSGIWSPRRSTA